MAKKKAAKKEINGNIIITFDDGSIQIIPAPIDLTAEEAESIFGEEETEEEEDEEEDDSEEEEEDEETPELTGEDLANMDFEELEDVCDDQDLDTDPDDFDEEEVEKLRKAIAKELGIELPKKEKKSKKSKK